MGELKNEKDVHDIINPSMGIEIKGSSNATQIFANRSYAQPSSDSETKDKNGYYITINFEKVSKFNPRPKIKIIRFGYLEHKDWIAKVTSGANRSSIERTSHPAQFPEDLIKRLMLGFTNQNDLVLDPFMGSGTVASVSVELKRKFLGFEIEPNYCEIAKKRIQLKIQKCTTLFDNIPETNAIVPETAK